MSNLQLSLFHTNISNRIHQTRRFKLTILEAGQSEAREVDCYIMGKNNCVWILIIRCITRNWDIFLNNQIRLSLFYDIGFQPYKFLFITIIGFLYGQIDCLWLCTARKMIRITRQPSWSLSSVFLSGPDVIGFQPTIVLKFWIHCILQIAERDGGYFKGKNERVWVRTGDMLC